MNTVRSSNQSVAFSQKSNQSNVGVAFFTVGINCAWNGTRLSYSLTHGGFGTNNLNYFLVITVSPQGTDRNAITYLRVCTISYEIVTLVANQQFLNSLFNTTSLSGTVPGTSLAGVTDFSVIFSGMVDYTFIQNTSLVTFKISLSGSTFSVSGLNAKSSFIWFRNLVCPGGYYVSTSTSSCLACHFSC